MVLNGGVWNMRYLENGWPQSKTDQNLGLGDNSAYSVLFTVKCSESV